MQIALFKNSFLIRDKYGYGYHKDLPKPLTRDERDNSVQLQLEELGFETAYVHYGKVDTKGRSEAKKAGEYFSPDVSGWNPEPPKSPAQKELTTEEKAEMQLAAKGGDKAEGLKRDSKTKDLLSNDPWHLAAVYDTDDKGPTAMFVRRKVQKADTPEERALKEKARRERTEVLPGDNLTGVVAIPKE